MLLKRNAKRKAPSKARQPRSSGSPLETSLRFAAFMASFAGVFVAVDEGIAALLGNKRCAVLVRFIAALDEASC